MAEKDTMLLVGTAKGLFILRRNAAAINGIWTGRILPAGRFIRRFMTTEKGRSDLWAGPVSWHFGAELCKSTDMGATWDAPERMRIKMPGEYKKIARKYLADRPRRRSRYALCRASLRRRCSNRTTAARRGS